MSAIRFRMNKMMTWIGLIALNLAALRMLIVGRDLVLPIIGVILGGIFQFAVYRGLRRSGRVRGFWWVFASSGTIATISLFWTARDQESIPARLWKPYLLSIIDIAERSEDQVARLLGNGAVELALVVMIAIGSILPIVLVACAVGLVFSRFVADPCRHPMPAVGPPGP